MNNNYNYDSYKNNILPNLSNSFNSNNLNAEKKPIFAEDILSKNKGKDIKVYMSFTDSKEWCDRVFEGYLDLWGRDFILLYDKNNNRRYMVWNLYIDFIEFSDIVNI